MLRIWTRAWFAMWLAASPAWAGEYYLEGPAQQTRADAVGMSKSVTLGGQKTRVVRRYAQGDGWRYLLRVEGFDGEASAREAARTLATQLGVTITVFDSDGQQTREVGSATPEDVAEAPRAGAPEGRGKRPRVERPADRPADPDDAEAILRRVSEAHGGPSGGLAAIEAAKAVTFGFRRTLPSGLVAEHTWARRKDATYLEVRVTAGEGRSSRLLVDGAGAWLAVGDGALEPTDRDRAIETQAQFEPDQVVPFVLAFASALESRRELEMLQVEGAGEVNGRAVLILRYPGDRATGPMEIKVDSERWLVLEVAFEGEDLSYRFDRWKDYGSLMVPGRIRTWRAGALADTVDVSEFDLRSPPPEAWFAAP